MNPEATVFVVDDDEPSRESVRALIQPMGVRIELFESAEEFLKSYAPARPGCLVTDLRMLGMSGIQLQEQLNRRGIRIPTIVISAYADVPATVRAMQQGAVTLLEKPCRGMELWDAVEQALRRDERDRAEEAERREIKRRLQSLTPQENEVLNLVLQGVPNKAIAHRLDIGLRTVESRRSSIFRKMDVDTVATLVAAVTKVQEPRPDQDSV